MLEVQKYLRGGKTPEQLQEELGIKSYRHPDLPLVGFKYNQIDSPRSDPIVRECRGIVLHDPTWNVIAKPFDRFFNVGEFEDEFKKFDWSNFTVTDKVDGSLAIVYHYEHWHMNTSGSFGLGILGPYDGTWRELFQEACGVNPLGETIFHKLEQRRMHDYTLMFELCSPYNKVVARHPNPTVYLLGATKKVGNQWVDLQEEAVDQIAKCLGVDRPNRHVLHHHDAIHDFLISMSDSDPTYEGVILRDRDSRWKWKTSTYVALHHLKDNGNILSPKRLVPLVLAGEVGETVAYLPEVTSALERVQEILDTAFHEMMALWNDNENLESQKDFAMAVKHHKLASLLFKCRKVGGDGETLMKMFRESDQQLSKKWKRLSEVR